MYKLMPSRAQISDLYASPRSRQTLGRSFAVPRSR